MRRSGPVQPTADTLRGMNKRTFLIVVVVFLVLVAAAVAMQPEHGSALHNWLRSMHGR